MEKDKTIGVMNPKIKLMDKPQYLDNAGTFLTRTGFYSIGVLWKEIEKSLIKKELFFSERRMFAYQSGGY